MGRASKIGRAAAVVMATGVLGLAPAIASAQAAGSTVVVEQLDFGFKPGSQTVAPGAVTFAVKNSGARPHEIIVVKSDADPKGLPLKDGRVDEAAVNIVARLGRITPANGQTTGVLSADLAQGRYLVICNVGTHYAQGMSFSLVSGNAGAPAALLPIGVPAAPAPAPAAGAAPAAAAAPAPARSGTGGL
ncbi:MAG: sulfocyanin-like copper-binding protein, partial [Dehalococcoidia bacterium]